MRLCRNWRNMLIGRRLQAPRAVSKTAWFGLPTEAACTVGNFSGRKLARCLRLLLRSFQLPLESLQGGIDLIRSKSRLAVLAVAGAHQNSDVSESLFDEREIIAKLSLLLVCEGV